MLAGVPLAVQALRPPDSPSAPGAPSELLPADHFIFDLALPGRTVRAAYTNPHGQSMRIYDRDGDPVASVTLYAAGPGPARPDDAVDVTVNGVAGFYGTIHQRTADGRDLTMPGALAWPYRDGAWAVVYAYITESRPPGAVPLTQSQAMEIATVVRLDQQRAVRVPVRFHGPPDLELRGVMTGSVILQLGPQGTHRTSLLVSVIAEDAGCHDSAGTDVTIGDYTGLLQRRDGAAVQEELAGLAVLAADHGEGGILRIEVVAVQTISLARPHARHRQQPNQCLIGQRGWLVTHPSRRRYQRGHLVIAEQVGRGTRVLARQQISRWHLVHGIDGMEMDGEAAHGAEP